MGADDDDRIWFSKPRWKLCHEIDHCFVTGVAENWQWTPTMAEIDYLSPIFRTLLILLLQSFSSFYFLLYTNYD